MSQFEAMDPEDKIQLIAYWRTQLKIQMWQAHLREQELERMAAQSGAK